MITTTSYSKKGQLRYLSRMSLKRVSSGAILYTIILVIGIVLPIFSENYARAQSLYPSERVIDESYRIVQEVNKMTALFGLFLCAVPVLLAAYLFYYLYDKRQVDFYHSLPIPRKTIFLAKYTAGAITLFVPLLLCQLLALLSFFIFPLEIVDIGSLLGMALVQTLERLLGQLMIFSIAAFVAVNCSTLIELLGYSTLLSILGGGLGFMWSNLSGRMLYGFPYRSGGLLSSLFYLSPPTILVGFREQQTGWIDSWEVFILLGWAAASVLFVVVGIQIYNRRQSELAGQWGRNNLLSGVMKAFSAAIGAYFLSTIFYNLFGSMSWPCIVGALIGAPLGYILVEAATAKGFHTVRNSLPKIGLSCGAMLVAGCYFTFGGFGYETRVPELSSIQGVTASISGVDRNGFFYEEGDIRSAKTENDLRGDISPADLYTQDPELIEKIRTLHKFAIEKSNEFIDRHDVVSIPIGYQKKGLGRLNREYSFHSSAAELIAEIQLSPEWTKETHPLFRVVSSHVNGVSISDKLGNSVRSEPLDDARIEQLIEAGRQDLLDDTPQKFRDRENNLECGILTFQLKGILEVRDKGISPLLTVDRCSLLLRPSYARTIALLTEWGLMPAKTLDTQMVERIDISPFQRPEGYQVDLSPRGPVSGVDSYVSIPVTDPQLIRQILEKSSHVRADGIQENQVGVILQDSQANNGISRLNLYIQNGVLLELLEGSGIQSPYLLSDEELNRYIQKRKCTIGTRAVDTASFYNQADHFMEEKDCVSVGEYFESNFPEFLEGKSPAVKKAMYLTPFEDKHGVPFLYGRYLGIFQYR